MLKASVLLQWIKLPLKQPASHIRDPAALLIIQFTANESGKASNDTNAQVPTTHITNPDGIFGFHLQRGHALAIASNWGLSLQKEDLSLLLFHLSDM